MNAIVLPAEEFKALLRDIQDLKDQVNQLLNNQPKKWYTVKETAKMINRSENTVRILAHKDELKFKQGKRKIDISGASIEEFNKKYTVN